MKIVNLKKFIKMNIVLISIVIAILIIFCNKTYSNGSVSYKTEIIISGETLWSIAQNECKTNKYYENKDVRYVIYDLRQINNLEDSNVSAGQEIKIPKI